MGSPASGRPAILLHFWLAYDHPFEDGNGRTARALFYWSMRAQGYWLTEYLSISRILRHAPSKYDNAYLETETDDRDTTYFILYNLDVIRRAIDEMRVYLGRKAKEVRDFEAVVRRTGEFNYRQIAILVDAVRHPTARYTYASHATSHRVTRQSARTDLIGLRERGLLEFHREGKKFVFTPSKGLAGMLEAGKLTQKAATRRSLRARPRPQPRPRVARDRCCTRRSAFARWGRGTVSAGQDVSVEPFILLR